MSASSKLWPGHWQWPLPAVLAWLLAWLVFKLLAGQGVAAGLALGAADYISKPIDVEITRQRIYNLLEREQLRREVETNRDQLQQLVSELKETAASLEATVAHRNEELRSLAMQLLVTETLERRAVAGDLHDDLGQNLAIIKLKLSAIELPETIMDSDEGAPCWIARASHCARCPPN